MDQLGISLEDRLLLYCARKTMNESIRDEVRKIANNDLNWDYVVEKNRMNLISPLMYWNLSRTVQSQVPETIMMELETLYEEAHAQNIILYHELSAILKAFKDANIDVICLKGTFLAEIIYQDIGLRSLRDIDLLIKKDDLQNAKGALSPLGYRDIYPSNRHKKYWTRLCEEVQYKNPRRNASLGIHWHIQPPSGFSKIDITMFWKNAQRVRIAGIDVLALAPENLLQHLCVHLYKHALIDTLRLKWCCDIAEVIHYYREKINWKHLVQTCRNFEIEEPVYRGLRFAATYLDAAVPDEVLIDLCPDTPDSSTERRYRWPVPADVKKEKSWMKFGRIERLARVEGISNKIYLFLREIFPTEEFMKEIYLTESRKKIYAYYLVRLVRAFLPE
jgi:hypothetical protein